MLNDLYQRIGDSVSDAYSFMATYVSETFSPMFESLAYTNGFSEPVYFSRKHRRTEGVKLARKRKQQQKQLERLKRKAAKRK